MYLALTHLIDTNNFSKYEYVVQIRFDTVIENVVDLSTVIDNMCVIGCRGGIQKYVHGARGGDVHNTDWDYGFVGNRQAFEILHKMVQKNVKIENNTYTYNNIDELCIKWTFDTCPEFVKHTDCTFTRKSNLRIRFLHEFTTYNKCVDFQWYIVNKVYAHLQR